MSTIIRGPNINEYIREVHSDKEYKKLITKDVKETLKYNKQKKWNKIKLIDKDI